MIKIENSIFLIEDFLTKEELVNILSETSTNWQTQIKDRVSKLFDYKYVVEGIGNIKKLKSGESTEAHSDQHNSKCDCGWCIDNKDKKFVYGVVIYLNNDYTGGEVRYTQKNIIHKPVAGSLLCHPASEEYEHEVLTVNFGERKYITFFLSLNTDVV
jgi:hypothetical protein